MIFHENFCHRHMDVCDTPKWFELRSNVYKDVAAWHNKPFNVVYFDFSKPNCGWIDVTVYVNTEKVYTFPLSAAQDPFREIKMWMEDIVNDFRLSTDLYIEVEGRTIILHYEHIKLAEAGTGRMFLSDNRENDEWESYDANTTASDSGLFYIYDSAKPDIPVICYCRTKDFLSALYNGLMFYASRTANVSLIGKEWYYMNIDDNGNPEYCNWDFYNIIKSPLIEWNIDSRYAYRHICPKFKDSPTVQETVHMWAEWSDGLFWHQRGGCCGNAEGFFVDTDNTSVDLSDIPELRKWYDEFDNSDPLDGFSDEEYKDWYERGWKLARQVRKRMPPTVDLFYQWKYYQTGLNTHREISVLVPDERLLLNDKFKEEQ